MKYDIRQQTNLKVWYFDLKGRASFEAALHSSGDTSQWYVFISACSIVYNQSNKRKLEKLNISRNY